MVDLAKSEVGFALASPKLVVYHSLAFGQAPEKAADFFEFWVCVFLKDTCSEVLTKNQSALAV